MMSMVCYEIHRGKESYFVRFGLFIVSTTTSAVWLLAFLQLTNLPVLASRPTVMVVARRDLSVVPVGIFTMDNLPYLPASFRFS